LPEVRTGDTDFIAKNYVTIDEPKAIKDQFADLPFSKDLLKMMNEYEERESLEAKCTKDADIIAQMYIQWVLTWRGNKLAEVWFEGDYVNRVPHLRTESAKQLALSMKGSNPHEWWWSEFVDKGRLDHTHLNGKK
jgi:5'-deoxynucleotidase YfbR-like HD superfamily hydrolase